MTISELRRVAEAVTDDWTPSEPREPSRLSPLATRLLPF